MLTIKACRKLLPKSYASKSDKEIELLRNQYYQMAAFMFDVWHEQKLKTQATGESKPEDNNKSHA